ncbi:MAG: hypothetical protein M0C28_35365 [Candidatus Moduliflexus flocculans]|nr:hypothetical protein [Candidatus Moduliflexus flocculans]
MSEQDQAKAMEAYMKAGAVTADHEAFEVFRRPLEGRGQDVGGPGRPADRVGQHERGRR